VNQDRFKDVPFVLAGPVREDCLKVRLRSLIQRWQNRCADRCHLFVKNMFATRDKSQSGLLQNCALRKLGCLCPIVDVNR
jgi:hypothetical protein